MAKLYAEITSDKGGRVVGKGGDEYISIELKEGNTKKFFLVYHGGDTITLDKYHPKGGIESVKVIK